MDERISDTIGHHIRNIYKESELGKLATTEDFSVVQREDNRTVRWLILTAESNPRDKDLMIRLTINMLTGEH
ncbi:MAG: hypothetical protein ABIJ25_04650 [Pseudomonadota bacterium]